MWVKKKRTKDEAASENLFTNETPGRVVASSRAAKPAMTETQEVYKIRGVGVRTASTSLTATQAGRDSGSQGLNQALKRTKSTVQTVRHSMKANLQRNGRPRSP